jgi:metal-responsive CopG/Arc/MetJ family transcriptional regulator
MRKRIFTTPITIIISQELHQQLKELTDQKNISLSEWVRDAINQKLENYLKKQENKEEKM